jgi:hypothetical protein
MNSKLAVVLIALLVVGTLGGMTCLWDAQEPGSITHVAFDGDDPPPEDPDGIPSGDPEHPQGGGG